MEALIAVAFLRLCLETDWCHKGGFVLPLYPTYICRTAKRIRTLPEIEDS